MKEKLTLRELELLNTASAYNGTQHKEICGTATLELIEYKKSLEQKRKLRKCKGHKHGGARK